MAWKIADPTIHIILFWGFHLFGILVGTTAFLLMGRPFSRPPMGRPILGLFCGIIFGASFALLGRLMVDGRFFAATLNDQYLALEMANGDLKNYTRFELESIRSGKEANANYMLISTLDGELFRAGPCGPECNDMIRSVQAWLEDPNLSITEPPSKVR